MNKRWTKGRSKLLGGNEPRNSSILHIWKPEEGDTSSGEPHARARASRAGRARRGGPEDTALEGLSRSSAAGVGMDGPPPLSGAEGDRTGSAIEMGWNRGRSAPLVPMGREALFLRDRNRPLQALRVGHRRRPISSPVGAGRPMAPGPRRPISNRHIRSRKEVSGRPWSAQADRWPQAQDSGFLIGA